MNKDLKNHLLDRMIECGALALRDMARGAEPFLYSSGNRGPGYVMVKGLVSQRRLMETLVAQLALKVAAAAPDIEYVSGNATGGMVPAWILAGELEKLLGREVPYVYIRGSRKQGGHGELITGHHQNDFFNDSRRGIVCEELVNYAETTVNSALAQRDEGYVVDHGACILSYDHQQARARLAENTVTLISLFTLDDLLTRAVEGEHFEERKVDDYRAFLADPKGWQKRHGFVTQEG